MFLFPTDAQSTFTFEYHSKMPQADGEITCKIPTGPELEQGMKNKVELNASRGGAARNFVEVEVQEIGDP